MRNLSVSVLIMFFIGLLTATSYVNFANTEAFLNGQTHAKHLHHDYDRDGETDSAHSHHISVINILKLATPKCEALVVVFPELVSFQKYDFSYSPSFKPTQFSLSIFRPPIVIS